MRAAWAERRAWAIVGIVVAAVGVALVLGRDPLGRALFPDAALAGVLAEGDAALRRGDPDAAARASIAVAEAKALTTEISLQASEKLLELAGSRATLAEFGLDRHWRNARTHTLHDPVRWKYHAVGAWHLNQRHPARHSWI